MSILKKISALYLLIAILVSCSEPENRFINIPTANAEILERTGIDILAFQAQIEKDFKVDDGFYDSVMVQTAIQNTNELFKKYGYCSVRTNGDTITGDDRDSILFHFAHGLAEGIIQEECKPLDSLCITKMKYRENLFRVELPYGRLERSTSEFIYFDLYEKEYLTKEEFSFMTLWWYILSSAQVISDHECYEAQKKDSCNSYMEVKPK